MIFLRFFVIALAAGWTVSCAAVEALMATPTPPPVTDTPTLTPTIVWFPPSATPDLEAAATPRPPTPEMRPAVGSAILTDDFADPSAWNIATSDQAGAVVNNNRLILSAQSGIYMLSLRNDLVAGDAYMEITARPDICRGDDSYGVLVRANAVAYYRFSLTCNGDAFAERISVGRRELLQSPLPSGDVPRGAPGEVRIGVWASGSELRLFLNGRYQFGVSNPAYPVGTVGVFVNSAGETPVVVSFSRLTLQDVTYTFPVATPRP
jgi:hypothetical protein